MFSTLIANICEQLAGVFSGPFAVVGQGITAACGVWINLLRGVGL